MLKCRSVPCEGFRKDIRGNSLVTWHLISYSRFVSLLVSNNDDLEKRNIGSKITICFTACADTIFKDMMEPGIIIRSMRDIVRSLCMFMAKKEELN